MIPFLQTYWGPVLFFTVMFYLLAQGLRYSLQYHSWKPFLMFGVIVVVLTIGACMIVAWFSGTGGVS